MAGKRGAQSGQGRRNRAVFHALRMWPCKNIIAKQMGNDRVCGKLSANRFNCPACLERITNEHETFDFSLRGDLVYEATIYET